MAIAETVEGWAFRLRAVDIGDAEHILRLRQDEKLTRFLPPLEIGVEEQRDWIARQRERPGDYYFAVESIAGRQTQGFVGLYDVTESEGKKFAEWGRWILEPRSLAAMESAYLIYCFGFDDLCLDEIFCRSVRDNEQVLNFHDRFGLERGALLPRHYSMHGRHYDAVEHRISAERFGELRHELARTVEKVAVLARRSETGS